MHAMPQWFTMIVTTAAAVAVWWSFCEPRRRLRLSWLLLLLTLLSIGFAASRWDDRQPIIIERK